MIGDDDQKNYLKGDFNFINFLDHILRGVKNQEVLGYDSCVGSWTSYSQTYLYYVLSRGKSVPFQSFCPEQTSIINIVFMEVSRRVKQLI